LTPVQANFIDTEAELRRNGTTVLDLSVVKGRIIASAPSALDLDNMRNWIESLA
jgi:hypothetical protein